MMPCTQHQLHHIPKSTRTLPLAELSVLSCVVTMAAMVCRDVLTPRCTLLPSWPHWKWATHSNKARKSSRSWHVLLMMYGLGCLPPCHIPPPYVAFITLAGTKGEKKCLQHVTNPCNYARTWRIQDIFGSTWFTKQFPIVWSFSDYLEKCCSLSELLIKYMKNKAWKRACCLKRLKSVRQFSFWLYLFAFSLLVDLWTI